MDARDVTIVSSVKERFSAWPEQIRALRESAPESPLLLILSEPMGAATRARVLEEASLHPRARVVDSGLFLANPFELWNQALPLVGTPLTLFMFNDVYPGNPDCLEELLRAAETHPEADVFQPFIWEGEGQAHSAWTDLYFVRRGERLEVKHVFDLGRVSLRDPDTLPAGEQACFLEDHAFMVRTGFIQAESFLDPGCAYVKEQLDIALGLRFRGARIRSVPRSQVLYHAYEPIRPDDLLYHAHRRGETLCAGSAEHLRRKWDVDFPYDGIARAIVDQRLSGVAWTPPEDRSIHRDMALAWFVMTGINRFDGRELPAAYSELGRTVVLGRDATPARFPDFTPDYAERARALREGRLFRIESGDARPPDPDASFESFALLEVERGDAWGDAAGLILRHEDGAERAWIHARPRPGEERELEAVAARLGARLRLFAPGSAPTFPLDLSAELLHWAWRPLKVSDLSLLL